MSLPGTGEMTCPRCGFRQAFGAECIHCGVIFSKLAGAGTSRRPALRAPAAPPAASPSLSSGTLSWLFLAMALVAAYLSWPREPADVTAERPRPDRAAAFRPTAPERPAPTQALPDLSAAAFTTARPVPSPTIPDASAEAFAAPRVVPPFAGATLVRTPSTWYQGASGYESALAEARADNKPMTVYFRTDWCPACRQFDSHLLGTAEVSDFLRYVVKVQINPEAGTAENEISKRYGVHSYPSFFMHRPGETTSVTISKDVWRDGRQYLASPEEFVGILLDALR